LTLFPYMIEFCPVCLKYPFFHDPDMRSPPINEKPGIFGLRDEHFNITSYLTAHQEQPSFSEGCFSIFNSWEKT